MDTSSLRKIQVGKRVGWSFGENACVTCLMRVTW